QRFGNLYRRKVVPLVTPKSKAVITVSHYEQERIVRRLGINSERVHVVYNGINESRFNNLITSKEKDRVRNKYRLPENFILFLGNETARKNPEKVLEAYVRYASQGAQPLVLVTPGLSPAFISNKLRQLQATRMAQYIITPGYIADEDLPGL